jgi:nucleoid DNA-binding protein
MNKGELVETVASSLGESKAVATRAVEAVLAGLVESCAAPGAMSICPSSPIAPMPPP